MAQQNGKKDSHCSMLHCLNTFDTKGKVFVNFPTDLNLCMNWIENCGKKEYLEIFKYEGALPFLLRYVCQDHFSKEDFLEKDDPSKGVKQDAIPKPLVKSETGNFKINDACQQYLVGVELKQNDDGSQVADPEIHIKQEPEEVVIKWGNPLVPDLREFMLSNIEVTTLPNNNLDPDWEDEKKQKRSKRASQMANRRRNETPEQRAKRLERDRVRTKMRREQERELSLTDPEIEEKLRIRRMRDALLAAIKRQNESPEERALRREREKLRVREKRRKEKELSVTNPELRKKLELKKLQFKLMVALKRQSETPEQSEKRRERERNRVRAKRKRERDLSKEDAKVEAQLQLKRLKERVLKALKRQNETPAERAERLEKMRLKRRQERQQKLMGLALNSMASNFTLTQPKDSIDTRFNILNPASVLSVTLDTKLQTNPVDNYGAKEFTQVNDSSTNTTREELVSLQNKLNEVLKNAKKKTTTTFQDSTNHDYEVSTDDETSDESDDSEYEKYLKSVNSDDSSQDSVTLEPQCIIES